MRLCQPYLTASKRSLQAAAVAGCVTAGFGVAAALSLQHVIDYRLAGAPPAEALPWLAMLALAVLAAGCLSLSRATVLGRRNAWLAHALAPKVLEHELHVATDPQQRTRSLAAVETMGAFLAGSCARGVADLPWALAFVGAVWLFDADVASVTSAAAALLLIMAGAGARLSAQALAFDRAADSTTSGQNVVLRAGIDRGASLQHARDAAARWEIAQRLAIVDRYAHGQARGRRMAGAGLIVGGALLAVGWLLLRAPIRSELSVGQLLVGFAAIGATLMALARLAVLAPQLGAARAAYRHLLLLRLPRGAEARLTVRLSRPDLRAPKAAGWVVTTMAAATIIGVSVHWHLLPPELEALAQASLAADGAATVMPVSDDRSKPTATPGDREAAPIKVETTVVQGAPAAAERKLLVQNSEGGPAPSTSALQISSIRDRISGLGRIPLASPHAKPTDPSLPEAPIERKDPS
jgi:ABC-type protease/lipase transport system fused ATPase/permease subunit